MIFLGENLYKNITEKDIENAEKMLDDYTLEIIEKKQFEEIASKTVRTPHDVDIIRLYRTLRNLLYFNISIKPVSNIPIINSRRMLENSYIELLAIVNNRKCYNEMTSLADTILDLDLETSLNVLAELNVAEGIGDINDFNIYDRLDILKNIVSQHKPISREVRQPKISV